MDKIHNNPARVGKFTSSNISALMAKAKDGSFGKPALTYIAEVNFERKLVRALNNESNARALTWGKAVEKVAFGLLGLAYSSKNEASGDDRETLTHPTIKYWVGSPDGLKHTTGGKTVYDIKCPYTLKSYCTFYDCKTIEDVRANVDKGEDYYWQLVSNAIITGSKYAELIYFVPYKSQLELVREYVNNYDGDQNQFAWINWATDDQLPWLPEEGYYDNFKIIRWEVTQASRDELTARVKAAGAMLYQAKEGQQ